MSYLQLCNKNKSDNVYIWLNASCLEKETTSNFHLFEWQEINFPNVRGLNSLTFFYFGSGFVPPHHFTHNIPVTFHIVTGCSWAKEISLRNMASGK